MTTITTQLPNDEYAEARREWRDRYADLAQGKRNWQFAALGFFGLAVLTSTIALIQVRQVKRIPYLVQADPTGAIVTTIPQLSPSSTVIPLNRIEIATVAEFIKDARTVIADSAGEDSLLQWVKAHARGPADRFLGSYYEDGVHNPHLVARQHSVAITISSIVPIGPHSYQVRFVEQYFDRNGSKMDGMPDGHFVALVHTQVSADPGQDLNNPAGIEIVGLQWSPEQLPPVEAQ
jgi:type IV secretory pathway TrbF-like protein